MYHFCTITTHDHLYKTLALADSILCAEPEAHIHVLLIDGEGVTQENMAISFYKLEDLWGQPVFENIATKYKGDRDKLRWSLKPVFLHYLLENKGDKVLYLDNDIYFYSSPRFLFELLADHDILLTPHHYPYDPEHNQNWLEANYRVGLYNAGFIAVNTQAKANMIWWAKCCAYRCEKNALRGTFDDQKYLDLLPIINERTHIVRHKGCNVAEWNRAVVSRSKMPDGKVILGDKYPLVFIHFNNTTVRSISKGEEPALNDIFKTYFDNLKKYKPSLTAERLYVNERWIDDLKYYIWKVATALNF